MNVSFVTRFKHFLDSAARYCRFNENQAINTLEKEHSLK